MFSYYMLFGNEEEYLRFCDLTYDPALFVCLNIEIIQDHLCGISRDYPVQFIKKINTDVSVAEFRNAVFRDLYKDSSWKSADELCCRITSLYEKSRDLARLKEPLQKRIVSIHVLAQYFALLDDICEFISRFEAPGLRRALEVFQAYLNKPETITAKTDIYQLEALLESYLKVSLKVDRTKKTVTVTDSEYDSSSDELRELDCLSADLTGISVIRPFSIVNDSSMSALETLTLDSILRAHPDLADSIEEIPEVEMIWDQLLHFKSQICYYTAFIKLTEQLGSRTLPFCFPEFDDSARICAHGVYDLSLAIRNIEEESFCPVANDADLCSDTVGFILTGANQGGKTTYLRSVGISVYLAMCGCPVPARDIVLFPYQKIFALFGGGESHTLDVSRFEMEAKQYLLTRGAIDNCSLVLLNEYFTGTNRLEAVEILGQCLRELIEKRTTFGCVTHFQEITDALGADVNEHIQYLRANASPDNADGQQYVIKAGAPDGRA